MTFEFAINLKTAKAMGLKFSRSGGQGNSVNTIRSDNACSEGRISVPAKVCFPEPQPKLPGRLDWLDNHRGRILPLRDVVNQEPRLGDLRIEECLDAELHRYVRMARLFDAESAIYSNKLPELLDVRLMAMSPQAFTLSGFERIAGVEYAQSWLVTE